jgi:hypothetical protein
MRGSSQRYPGYGIDGGVIWKVPVFAESVLICGAIWNERIFSEISKIWDRWWSDLEGTGLCRECSNAGSDLERGDLLRDIRDMGSIDGAIWNERIFSDNTGDIGIDMEDPGKPVPIR